CSHLSDETPIRRWAIRKLFSEGLYDLHCCAVITSSNATWSFLAECANKSSSTFERMTHLYFHLSAYKAFTVSGKGGQSLTDSPNACFSRSVGVNPKRSPMPAKTFSSTARYGLYSRCCSDSNSPKSSSAASCPILT